MLWLYAVFALAVSAKLPTPGQKIPNEYIVTIDFQISDKDYKTHIASVEHDYEGRVYEEFDIGKFRGYAIHTSKDKALELLQRHGHPIMDVEENQYFVGIPVSPPKMRPRTETRDGAKPAPLKSESFRRLMSGEDDDRRKRSTCLLENEAPWGLVRTCQVELSNNGEYAYGELSDGTGVRAYIVDTGIRTTHSDFEGRAVWGTDTADYPSPETDGNGHGTHVAGTVFGKAYGIAKGAEGIAVKVLSSGGFGSTAGVIEGIEWVAQNERENHSNDKNLKAVANMSLGGGFSSAMNEAVAAATEYGRVVFAVAAGNESQRACNVSPASEPKAITVACSDNADTLCYFSNWGTCVDLVAPGLGITSAWNTGDEATNTISGTSMSSPHVAGVIAKMLSSQNFDSVESVREALLAMTNDDKLDMQGVLVDNFTPNKLLYMDCNA